MSQQNHMPPTPIGVPKSVIEKYAETISRQFSLTEFGDEGDPVVRFVAQLGGEIHYEDPDDFVRTEDGSIVVDGPNKFDVYISNFTGPLRDRFTLAHELGHYFLHSQQGKSLLKASRRGNSPAEWEANWFAASLLMPSDDVREFCTIHNTTDATLVAAQFRVSRSAAEYRLKALGI